MSAPQSLLLLPPLLLLPAPLLLPVPVPLLPPLLLPLKLLVCPLLLLPFALPVKRQLPAMQPKPAQQSADVVQLPPVDWQTAPLSGPGVVVEPQAAKVRTAAAETRTRVDLVMGSPRPWCPLAAVAFMKRSRQFPAT